MVAHEMSTEELFSDLPDLAVLWIQKDERCHLDGYLSIQLTASPVSA